MRSQKILLHDLALFVITAVIAMIIGENHALTTTHISELAPYVLIGVPTAAFSFLMMGTHRGLWRHVSFADTVRIISSVLIAIAVTMFLMFSVNSLDGLSRTLPLLQFPLLVIAMLGARYYVRAFRVGSKGKSAPQTATRNRDRESVLIVGLSHVTELYLQCVRSMAGESISVEGILEDNQEMMGRLFSFTKVIGQPRELSSILAMFNVHGVTINRVVVTVPFMQLSEESREVLLRFERSGAIELDMFEERLGFKSYIPAEPEPTIGEAGEAAGRCSASVRRLATVESSMAMPFPDRHYKVLKRVMDVVGAAFLIVMGLPVFLLVSLFVAYDVGAPLIFWQERPGKNGKLFRVLKFRTMHSGHDRFGNIIPDEKRTSKIGHLLRRARMDELPQLYHILIGEMSFVGPRPLLMKFQPNSTEQRLSVRPGVTGWAQVNGGNLLSAEEKNALDMWYLNHTSLAFDVKIIFKTLLVAMQGNGDRLDSKSRAAIRMAFYEQRRLGASSGQLAVVGQQAVERNDVADDDIMPEHTTDRAA